MSALIHHINKPLPYLFILLLLYTQDEYTPTVFLDDRITKSTVFHWFLLKPSSCYPPHRTLHMLDKLFIWWFFTMPGFCLCSSIQTKYGKENTKVKIKLGRSHKTVISQSESVCLFSVWANKIWSVFYRQGWLNAARIMRCWFTYCMGKQPDGCFKIQANMVRTAAWTKNTQTKILCYWI